MKMFEHINFEQALLHISNLMVEKAELMERCEAQKREIEESKEKTALVSDL